MQELSLDRLYRQMGIAGLTVTELAKKTGISRQAMHNIINGKSQPKAETLDRMCQALGCQRGSLFGPDERHTDHARFADVMVARRMREHHDYDVEAAVLEYIHNWLVEHYNDLDHERYVAARAEADRLGEEFAGAVCRMLVSFELLDISYDAQARAAEEAFVSFFEVLTTMLEMEIGIDPELEIFDYEKEKGMQDDIAQAIYEEEQAERYEDEEAERREEYEEEQRIQYEEEQAERYADELAEKQAEYEEEQRIQYEEEQAEKYAD